MTDKTEKTKKKDYDFGELEVSTFEEVVRAYDSVSSNYKVYAIIPMSPRCDGFNSPVDPC